MRWCENIVDCGEDKDVSGDSIGDCGVDINDGSDPDFGDDKTKVDCSGNTAGNNGNSKDDGGPNDGGGVDTNDNNCDGDDADTDGDNDNNVADGDKNDGDGNETDKGGDNTEGEGKDGGRDDCDDKHDIDFEDDDGVRGEYLQSNFVIISTIFDANLSFPVSIRCK